MNPEDNEDESLSFASFYFDAENDEQVDDRQLSPSIHSLAEIVTRYEPVEFIAEGGMKQIHKVYDAQCKRHVAMATLRENAPPELRDPLVHEAWLTAHLDHPNIIKIHDVGVDANLHPYFTMDLKVGKSLAELIGQIRSGAPDRKLQHSLSDLLRVFVKICDAIAYAHSIDVVHLDLKPANIQVGRYGEVLVCDWGLGRVLQNDTGIDFERTLLNADLFGSNTLFGETRGTPGFMAPEQIDQDAPRDKRTDIYQLGCVLYAILTLRAPVDTTLIQSFDTATLTKIVPPSQRAPEQAIPASLAAVCSKAMSLERADRYESVERLGEEVQRYLTGFATKAEEAGLWTQCGLFYKRNQRFCTTVLCSCLILIGGAAFAYWQLAEKEWRATNAQLKAEHSLELYKSGVDRLEELSIRNAKSVAGAAVQMHLAGDRVRSEKLLVAALEAAPGNPVYLRCFGEHCFIMQRFNQASDFLRRGEKRSPRDQLVCELALEFGKLKPDDDQPLSTEQVILLLDKLHDFDGLEAMIVINDRRNRPDPNQRAAIIREHLASINPDWQNGWFEYDDESSRLRVGGKGLWRLSASGRILAGLQPRHLDISGSEISELWTESGYAIETLDVRGCPLVLRNLSHFIHLETLIVQPGQFTASELGRWLPDSVEVVEKPGP